MDEAPSGGARTLRLDEEDDPVAEAIGRRLRAKFRPALVVVLGSEAEVGRRVTVDGNVRIGRDPDVELVLNDAGVSWRHALVEDRGDGWSLVDLGSTNGTLLNGDKVTEAPLRHGDKIRVGKTIIRYEVQDAVDEAYSKVVSDLINIDDLTGLLVRRRFDAEVSALIDRAASSGESVGMLVMDLDGIKGINDQHGHLFGAYTISESGKLIARIIAHKGIGCRFGGDEFIAALPGCDLDATVAVGEQIRAAISAHVFEREGIRLHPGISVGVSAFPAHAADALSLFQSADEALYRAKRGGKNQVCT